MLRCDMNSRHRAPQLAPQRSDAAPQPGSRNIRAQFVPSAANR